MKKSKLYVSLTILVAMALLALVSTRALATPFIKVGIPDFGQEVGGWCDYCAPTSAANSVWYFANNGFPLLAQGKNWGTDDGANKVITDLAWKMDTNGQRTNPGAWEGTKDEHIRDGLQGYFNSYYPKGGSVWFDVDLVDASNIGGGLKLWEFMKKELYRCEDVLALFSWWDPINNVYDGGHAVTMTGYNDNITISINDPATDSNKHNWNGEYLDLEIEKFASDWIEFKPWSSAGLYVPRLDAVVVASPIPEPSALILFGSGLAGIGIMIRRKKV